MGKQIRKIRGRKSLVSLMDMRHYVNGQKIGVGRPKKPKSRGRPKKVGRPRIKKIRKSNAGRPKIYWSLNK